MNLFERTKWTKGLIAKISVITGWVVPFDEILIILVDQLEKKLCESYPNVNPDEVEFAFRTRGTTLKDWGKEMNLSMIDEVMIPYLEERMRVSIIEEQQKVKLLPTTKKEDLSEKAMSEWWKEVERRVRVDHYKMEFLPVSLYEWMDKQGGINKTAKEKKEYIKKATDFRRGKLMVDNEKDGTIETKRELDQFNEMINNGCLTGLEVKKVTDTAKRMILYEMLASEDNA